MTMVICSDEQYGNEVVLPGGVAARCERAVWDTAEKPFPLSPDECWYLLQGWSVRPVGDLTQLEVLQLPGRPEGSSDSWLTLYQV
jgi:hypothetical protein